MKHGMIMCSGLEHAYALWYMGYASWGILVSMLLALQLCKHLGASW
jgi:hypothetical protein